MYRVACLACCAFFAAAFFVGATFTTSYAEVASTAPPAKAEAVTGPKMEASPESFDFGTIDEGAKPTAVFTIKNVGTGKLVIFDAKPSCGCTLASLSAKELEPGQVATLEAVYNSQNAHGGPISKYVTVSTNDPATPSKMLRIVGTVNAKPAPMLILDPFRADKIVLPSGKSENRLVKLVNNGQKDLHITEITTSKGITANLNDMEIAPAKTVKMAFIIKPGETRTMAVTIAPEPKPGSFQEVITIRSDAKGRPATVYVAAGVVQ